MPFEYPYINANYSSFRYYLGKILTQAGITSTKTQTQVQVIINCWSFAVAVLGSFMLDILGRRIQTFIGVGGMVSTLLLIGGLIKRKLCNLIIAATL
jgi:hypothetical protein